MTANGGIIPQANITVFLNTQVTSRLLGNGSVTNASEAVLLIDEPNSGLQGTGPAQGFNYCATPASGCIEYAECGSGQRHAGCRIRRAPPAASTRTEHFPGRCERRRQVAHLFRCAGSASGQQRCNSCLSHCQHSRQRHGDPGRCEYSWQRPGVDLDQRLQLCAVDEFPVGCRLRGCRSQHPSSDSMPVRLATQPSAAADRASTSAAARVTAATAHLLLFFVTRLTSVPPSRLAFWPARMARTVDKMVRRPCRTFLVLPTTPPPNPA